MISLMFGNKHVLDIDVDTGKTIIVNKKLVPYGLYLDIEDDINNLFNFNYWLSSRMLVLDRKYSKEILNYLNIKQAVTDRDRAQIVLKYRCVSVQDNYWTKELGESIRWEDVNLFDNSLSESIFDVALKGRVTTITSTALVSQDLNAQGVYPKAWKRIRGILHLYKANGDDDSVNREVCASDVLNALGILHVRYKYAKDSGILTSVCRCITDKSTSIVTAKDMEVWCTNNDEDLVEYAKSINSIRYHQMNLADYLLGNSDRHLGNWGFLVDENNEVIDLHPLFDFNNCFKIDSIDGALCLPENNKITQLQAAINAVKEIGFPNIEAIDSCLFRNDEDYKVFMTKYAKLQDSSLGKMQSF